LSWVCHLKRVVERGTKIKSAEACRDTIVIVSAINGKPARGTSLLSIVSSHRHPECIPYLGGMALG